MFEKKEKNANMTIAEVYTSIFLQLEILCIIVEYDIEYVPILILCLVIGNF